MESKRYLQQFFSLFIVKFKKFRFSAPLMIELKQSKLKFCNGENLVHSFMIDSSGYIVFAKTSYIVL